MPVQQCKLPEFCQKQSFMFQSSSTFDRILDATFSHRTVSSPSQTPKPHLDISAYKEPEHKIREFDERAGEEIDADQTASHCIETEGGKFWVQGDNVLCSCPDCTAPMTVRVWLGLADCWRCTCSIELSREQLAAVQQLANSTTVEAPNRGPLQVAPPMPSNQIDFGWEEQPRESGDATERELERLTSGSSTARLLRRTFSMTPAWLVSFLVHLILILILALIVFNQTDIIPSIMLSTFVGPERQQGGEIRIVDLNDELVDDLREANNMELSDQEMRDVVQEAQKDAQELLKDVVPQRNLDDVKKNITTRSGPLSSFAARDPRVRTEVVKKAGGSTLTEAAVARGLRWLASVQNDDGSWSLGRYRNSNKKNNRGDAAGTSLALLPFLGAGQTHENGIYRETVAKGLAWMIANQKPNGDLRANFRGNAGMYAHGQGAIVLSEAFALTGDQSLAEPAQLAIDFIQQSQHKVGGWRYEPGQSGDTSVFGWQLMALHSARAPNMGIEVDEDVMKLADYYLDRATASRSWLRSHKSPAPEGSLYCYQPGRDSPTKTMTAEAILCRMYLGWDRDDPRVSGAVNWLLDKHLPDEDDEGNMYYWYYGTQVFHHYGGEPWKKWNKRMRALLLESQVKKGKYAGSWDPDEFQWGQQGERIYLTSLGVCTLEVYYRHLPLFAPIEFD